MVCVAGDGHVVVEVDAEALYKLLRCVGLALIFELLRAFAEVCVENSLQANLPLAGDFLCRTLCNGSHVWLEQREELIEVVERVAVERAREWHRVLWADAVLLHGCEHVLGRAALSELAVAVVAHHLYSTVHIGLVGNERLAEVVGFACGFQYLGLEEADGAVVPAGARAVLVLDGGDGVLLHYCEHWLVLVLGRLLLLGCAGTDDHYGHECKSYDSFHYAFIKYNNYVLV